jgi:hypothetical protein
MKKIMITSILLLSFSMAMASEYNCEPNFSESKELTMAGVDGVWTALLVTPNGPFEVTFTFKIVKNKITGSMSSDRFEFPVKDGTVNGENIEVTIDRNGNDWKLTGKIISEDAILMSYTDRSGEPKEMNLNRKKG